MKREILFKGKSINSGEWVESMTISKGTIKRKKDWVFMELSEGMNIGVIPETVGQFTGMIDCNGTKIFEGDIVIANCAPSGAKSKKVKDHKCVVEYCELHHGWSVLILDYEPGEKWMTGYMSYGRNGSALKVIGNIHDVKEPELVNEAV